MDRFPEALHAIPDAAVIVDAGGVIRAANPRVESVFGRDPAALVGADMGTFLYDPEDGRSGEKLRERVANGEPRSMAAGLDLAVRRGDRNEVPVTVSLGPFERDDGTYLLVTVVDVSAEHAERAAVSHRTRTLEALHEATQDLLKTTDREVAAKVAVEYIEEVLGHPLAAIWLYDDDVDALEPIDWTSRADEVIGTHPTFDADGSSISWDVFESGEAQYVPDTHDDPDRLNSDTVIRSELVLPLGRYGVINVGATEMNAFDGSDLAVARLWAATVTMVFVRIERERQLRDREAEIARERDRLEEFAALVSHDLRNPLNVAVGNLEIVRTRLEAEDVAFSEVDAIDAIDRALDRMGVLIEDVLTLAKQGTAIDETESVALSTLVAECWGSVDTEAAELVVRGDLRLRADRSRLRQAMENLFANAVIHAGRSVRVEVGPLDDRSGFYVADDGPGIPADRRDEVMNPGVSTDPDGTGFGLKIVSEVANAHGWSLSLVEADGGGARFEFRGVDTAEPVAEGEGDESSTGSGWFDGDSADRSDDPGSTE